MMRLDLADIQATLQHVDHLVPGIKDLAAIDAADGQTVPDDFLPVDLRLLGMNTKNGNLSAVVHIIDHGGKSGTIAGHFQTDIEAFLQADVLDGFFQTFSGHVDRIDRRRDLFAQVQAVVVHIGDDDTAGADMVRNCCSHHTNCTAAGDQDILADHIIGQCCMDCIAQRIKGRNHILRNGVRNCNRNYIILRNDKILSKRTIPVYTNANGITAEVLAAFTTVTADTAGDVAFTGHDLAHFILGYCRADFNDFTTILVADRRSDFDRFLGPFIPVVNMQIGAADGGLMDFDLDIIGANFWYWNFLQCQTRTCLGLDQCIHQTLIHSVSSSPSIVFVLHTRRINMSLLHGQYSIVLTANQVFSTKNVTFIHILWANVTNFVILCQSYHRRPENAWPLCLPFPDRPDQTVISDLHEQAVRQRSGCRPDGYRSYTVPMHASDPPG